MWFIKRIAWITRILSLFPVCLFRSQFLITKNSFRFPWHPFTYSFSSLLISTETPYKSFSLKILRIQKWLFINLDKKWDSSPCNQFDILFHFGFFFVLFWLFEPFWLLGPFWVLFREQHSLVPELSFLPAPYRGWTRACERRVQDNLHAHAQNAAIFFP